MSDLLVEAKERDRKLRAMAMAEQDRERGWRISQVLRYDADLIRSLVAEIERLHESLRPIVPMEGDAV